MFSSYISLSETETQDERRGQTQWLWRIFGKQALLSLWGSVQAGHPPGERVWGMLFTGLLVLLPPSSSDLQCFCVCVCGHVSGTPFHRLPDREECVFVHVRTAEWECLPWHGFSTCTLATSVVVFELMVPLLKIKKKKNPSQWQTIGCTRGGPFLFFFFIS